jgi:hypothetical protein
MAARPRGRITIASQRIIRAKFDTQKALLDTSQFHENVLLQLEKR